MVAYRTRSSSDRTSSLGVWAGLAQSFRKTCCPGAAMTSGNPRNSSGSLAKFAATRRTSSRESRCIDICHCGQGCHPIPGIVKQPASNCEIATRATTAQTKPDRDFCSIWSRGGGVASGRMIALKSLQFLIAARDGSVLVGRPLRCPAELIRLENSWTSIASMAGFVPLIEAMRLCHASAGISLMLFSCMADLRFAAANQW